MSCRICGLEEERDGLCAGHREEWIQWASRRPWAQNDERYDWWIDARVAELEGVERRPPLLKVIFVELAARGWKVRENGASAYEDPEGNLYPTLEDAVRGQSIREIASGEYL